MKLKAKLPIEHDNQPYAIDDVLEIEDKTAAQALIDCGAAEEAPAEAAARPAQKQAK